MQSELRDVSASSKPRVTNDESLYDPRRGYEEGGLETWKFLTGEKI